MNYVALAIVTIVETTKWYARPEWWLLIVTALTALFIAWQSWETRKAAQAARDSIPLQIQAATAAQRSADVLIVTERAWVTVDIEWQIGAHMFHGSGTEGESTGIYVDYVCRNVGNSFAQVLEKGYIFKIVNTLPVEPQFDEMDIFFNGNEYLKPNVASQPYRLSAICKGHHKPDKLMVLYGRVKYRDVFGEHETIFGYLITGMGNLDRLPASTYPEYNNHT